VEAITPYIMVAGMFESKGGSEFVVQKEINPTIYDWKHYNTSVLQMNSHDLLELKFDLSDATFHGTADYI
jgi:hypothetical protein